MSKFREHSLKLKMLSDALFDAGSDIKRLRDHSEEDGYRADLNGLDRTLGNNRALSKLGVRFSTDELQNAVEYLLNPKMNECVDVGIIRFSLVLSQAAEVLENEIICKGLAIEKHGVFKAGLIDSKAMVATIIAHTTTQAGFRGAEEGDDFEFKAENFKQMSELIEKVDLSPQLKTKHKMKLN